MARFSTPFLKCKGVKATAFSLALVQLSLVRIGNVRTKEIHEEEAGGIFIYVGLDPLTEAFKDTGITNEDGWIITDTQMRTSVPGVYAVGDVREKELRQVTTAVGDGSIAGQQVFQFIEEQKDPKTTV